MKLTDYVVEFLQKKGIRDFFGYQGTMIAHLVVSGSKIFLRQDDDVSVLHPSWPRHDSLFPQVMT